MVERQTPNLRVGGSNPSWPASVYKNEAVDIRIIVGVVMKNVVKFFYEVRIELSKVIWPSWDEFIGSTVIVLVVIAFFSVYLGVLDSGLSQLANYTFERFGIYGL